MYKQTKLKPPVLHTKKCIKNLRSRDSYMSKGKLWQKQNNMTINI